MSQEKDNKVYLYNPLPDLDYRAIKNLEIVEPFSFKSSEFKEGEPELAFQVLEEGSLVFQEELEIPLDLYNEVRSISEETGRSIEKIVKGALKQYIDKRKKRGKATEAVR